MILRNFPCSSNSRRSSQYLNKLKKKTPEPHGKAVIVIGNSNLDRSTPCFEQVAVSKEKPLFYLQTGRTWMMAAAIDDIEMAQKGSYTVEGYNCASASLLCNINPALSTCPRFVEEDAVRQRISSVVCHIPCNCYAPNYLLGETTVTRQNKVRTEFLLVV